MGMNAHENSKSQQYSNHGSPAITDERQWYPNNGQNTTYHTHIDEHVSEKS